MTGKAPISTRWVDTDKTHGIGEPMVRSRWVARDFKDAHDKGREDLLSATPPLELIRLVLSRQATRRKDGKERKTMYLDVKKAHFWRRDASKTYMSNYPKKQELGKMSAENSYIGCTGAAPRHRRGKNTIVGCSRRTTSRD